MPKPLLTAVIALFVLSSALVRAQDDEDIPLGDLARAARKAKPAEEQTVIDNDNLNVMMDKAESERLNGKPVFSIDSSGNAFRMTSPDGTCSLSFDAKATALISTPFVSSELPQDELLKLEGPATIHDGILEVSLHNGTGWEVKEIVVGITVVQTAPVSEFKPAKMIGLSEESMAQKLPDMTMLYHLKATSPPDADTVFRADIGGDVDAGREWHWALIGARGIPPAAPGSIEQSLPAVSSEGPATMPSISLPAPKSASATTSTDNSTLSLNPAGLPSIAPVSAAKNPQAPAPASQQ